MTKDDLVKEISASTGVCAGDVMAIVNSFMQEVKDSVCKGEPVYLRGFGSFGLKKRSYKLFHAAPGKYIPIPEHYEPVLKFSPVIKDAVKNKTI